MDKVKKTGDGTIQVVSFVLDGEEYGAAIESVREILRYDRGGLTEMPMAAPHVEGLLNLRGTAIPVINLRVRMGRPAKSHDGDTRVIIADMDGNDPVGFVVDSVSKVTRFPESDMEQPPAVMGAMEGVVGMAKWDGRITTVMDLSALVK